MNTNTNNPDLMLAKKAEKADLATGKFAAPRWVMEPKIDGMRVGISKRGDTISLYSRTHKPQAGKLPHIEAALRGFEGDFNIDAEVVALTTLVETDQGLAPLGDFNRTMRIMGAKADKAAARQDAGEPLVILVFDAMSVNGEFIQDSPESDRRKTVEAIVAAIDSPYVGIVPRYEPDIETYQQYCDAGGEGMMLKDTNAGYVGKRRGHWLKVKVEITEDAIVTGFKPGKGKYADTIGAIIFSQYNADGVLVERGACSGMDDATRYDIGNNPDAYLGQVLEVKSFGQATEAEHLEGLRHPVFVTFRDDKNPEDCTF